MTNAHSPIFSGSVSLRQVDSLILIEDNNILKSVAHNDRATNTQNKTERYFQKLAKRTYLLKDVGMTCIDDKTTKSI